MVDSIHEGRWCVERVKEGNPPNRESRAGRGADNTTLRVPLKQGLPRFRSMPKSGPVVPNRRMRTRMPAGVAETLPKGLSM